MKRIEYLPGNDWNAERLVLEDEHGNHGEVRFPRERQNGYGAILRSPNEWIDAEVVMRHRVEDSADGAASTAEFLLQLSRMAKTMDLACAEEAERVKTMQQRQEEEREAKQQCRDKAVQMRCDEVAQFYMQMVRVQREGYSSNAKGELLVNMVKDSDSDTERVQPRMWLKESHGGRWDFRADQIAKFERKDGNRYVEVKLTPMDELEEQARKELVQG